MYQIFGGYSTCHKISEAAQKNYIIFSIYIMICDVTLEYQHLEKPLVFEDEYLHPTYHLIDYILTYQERTYLFSHH